MLRRRRRSSKKIKPFRRVLLERITTVIILLVVYLSLGILAATLGTSIFHTFGGGFSLRDDAIRTSVLVRNDAPFSFPGIELPYSYGANIDQGNARCELETVEGIKACGSGTVGLGTIKQGEVRNGTVTVFPNHGNFTIRYVASVWVFFFHGAVANVAVSCWTKDGISYSCVGSDEQRPGAPPGVLGLSGANLLAVMLLVLAVILMTALLASRKPIADEAPGHYSETRTSASDASW